MIKIIATFLILKGISNGIKAPQRGGKNINDFIGQVVVEGIMLIIHTFFGLWMLINL
jgi:hypothetical protein